MQNFYLTSGESKSINFELSQDELKSTIQKLQTDECVLFLRVVYRTAVGEYLTKLRRLGGFRRGEGDIKGIAVLSLPEGDVLTGPLGVEVEQGPLWALIPMA